MSLTPEEHKKTIRTDHLDIENLPIGELTYLEVAFSSDGMAAPIDIPTIVIRGKKPGPVVGITAAVHGNELNGLPIIHQLCQEIRPHRLRGTLVAVPVVNVPAFLTNSRYFHGGGDLNRLFPGKANGNCGEHYAHQFVDKFIRHFQYLIDLHTASFGRINSLYVRADLSNGATRRMAYLQHPQIVVHNCGADGTLRSAAAQMGIEAITVEVGNPQLIQKRLVKTSIIGLRNVLSYLKMVPRLEKPPKGEPVICAKSYWLYTDRGGILEVLPELVDFVKKGELIAKLRDVYGRVIRQYRAPEAGIVIGKSTNPVGSAGSRILHLGIVKTKGNHFSSSSTSSE